MWMQFKNYLRILRENEEAVAETIENNIRKVIIDEQPINPKYYENMSILFDELIKQRKVGALSYKAYLEKIVKFSKQVKNPGSSIEYPASMDTSSQSVHYMII